MNFFLVFNRIYRLIYISNQLIEFEDFKFKWKTRWKIILLTFLEKKKKEKKIKENKKLNISLK